MLHEHSLEPKHFTVVAAPPWLHVHEQFLPGVYVKRSKLSPYTMLSYRVFGFACRAGHLQPPVLTPVCVSFRHLDPEKHSTLRVYSAPHARSCEEAFLVKVLIFMTMQAALRLHGLKD